MRNRFVFLTDELTINKLSLSDLQRRLLVAIAVAVLVGFLLQHGCWRRRWGGLRDSSGNVGARALPLRVLDLHPTTEGTERGKGDA